MYRYVYYCNRGLRAHLPKISHRLAHRLITWLTVSPRGSPSLFLNKWGTDSTSGSRLTTWLISSPNLLTMVLHPTYRFTAWLTCSPNLLTRFLHLTQRLSLCLTVHPRGSPALFLGNTVTSSSGFNTGSPSSSRLTSWLNVSPPGSNSSVLPLVHGFST